MTEQEIFEFLKEHYNKENEHCEWKAFSNLKNSVSSSAASDVISYVSAISNMQGGHLVIGVEDTSLKVLGIQNFHDYTPENLPNRLIGNCPNLSSEGLWVEPLTASDSGKTIWILHIPKHLPRQPVLAHKKAWQRSGDSLIELTPSRRDAILSEQLYKNEDWSASLCPKATLGDLDADAIQKARDNYKIKNPRLVSEIDSWDDFTFLKKTKLVIGDQITRAAIILLGKPESVILCNLPSFKLVGFYMIRTKMKEIISIFLPLISFR